MNICKKLFVALALLLGANAILSAKDDEVVYQDSKGVIRWKSDKTPMGVFGANYCLTSSNDFRAAGFVGRDYKSMIDEDMIHFTRMGWRAVRACIWGDWECSDKEGNLIVNEHIDCLDYLIAKASERGIAILLSPIVTYGADFENGYGTKFPGFSANYTKEELITNKECVKAEANYMTQLLNHVNPYTGRRLADEPWITFIELINEPSMLIDKPEETKYFINTLVDAIRKTGCKKLLYYNISQDFRIIPIIKDTKIQGGSYAWYPTALNHNYMVNGNILPLVSDYSALKEDIGKRSRIVYEFDTPDVSKGYLYPAMAREYREGGIQFATMFTYDFLATAKWNLSWITHHLNMVYTPDKAVSAIIAAEAMQRLPMGKDWGKYPGNSKFRDFMIDYDRDLSLLNSGDALMYNSDIFDIAPKDPAKLARIVGLNSSTLVRTASKGIYFLDKIKDGQWRVEVHPGIYQINDPFDSPSLDKPDYVVDDAPAEFTFSLPGIPSDFVMKSISGASVANNGGTVSLAPGVYVISKDDFSISSLPEKVGSVRMKDFATAPGWMPEKPALVYDAPKELLLGEPVKIECQVFSEKEPESVNVTIGGARRWFARPTPMKKVAPHTWQLELPAYEKPTVVSYSIDAVYGGKSSTLGSYSVKVVKPEKVGLEVFNAGTDNQYDFSRYYNSVVSIPYTPKFNHSIGYDDYTEPYVEISTESLKSEGGGPADISFSKYIVPELKARTAAGLAPKAISVRAQAASEGARDILVVFTQSDCKSWSVAIPLDGEMATHEASVGELKADVAAMLPRDFPGVNSYYYPDLNEPGDKIDWSKVEKCTVSVRSGVSGEEGKPLSVRVNSVTLEY